jgi:serine/threonine-protein kinase RsbW
VIEALGPIVVSIPARADAVHVVRAVVASVGARVDLAIDDVEELRIAVDEAAALLLHLHAPPGRLTATVSVDAGELSIRIASDVAVSGDWPPPGAEEAWPWLVIVGLTDAAGFDVTTDGPAVWMTKLRDADTAPAS